LERLKTAYASVPGTDRDKILPTVGLNVGRMQVQIVSEKFVKLRLYLGFHTPQTNSTWNSTREILYSMLH
jgi:hypothetical protein